jgi:hypothetical protein
VESDWTGKMRCYISPFKRGSTETTLGAVNEGIKFLLLVDINSLIRIARDIYESDREMSLRVCIEKKHGSIPGTGIGGDIVLALMSRMGGTSAVIRIQRWSRCCKSISVPKCILRACQTLVAMIMAGS